MNRREFLRTLLAVPMAAVIGSGLVLVHWARIANPIRGRRFDGVYLDDLVSPIRAIDRDEARKLHRSIIGDKNLMRLFPREYYRFFRDVL